MKLVSSKMCLVKNVGVDGNLFGGEMLAWMDEISAIFAMKTLTNHLKHTYDYNYFEVPKLHLVTLRFGEILFKKPVKVGNIVDFYCGEVKLGNTSISFDIEGRINNTIVFKTDCTFVRVDENGNKTELLNI